MKPYVLSLALGLLVGVIYALFQVRSPAPPVIALVGLIIANWSKVKAFTVKALTANWDINKKAWTGIGHPIIIK